MDVENNQELIPLSFLQAPETPSAATQDFQNAFSKLGMLVYTCNPRTQGDTMVIAYITVLPGKTLSQRQKEKEIAECAVYTFLLLVEAEFHVVCGR